MYVVERYTQLKGDPGPERNYVTDDPSGRHGQKGRWMGSVNCPSCSTVLKERRLDRTFWSVRDVLCEAGGVTDLVKESLISTKKWTTDDSFFPVRHHKKLQRR